MYRYGVKKINLKDGRISISSTYTPRNETMKRKLGNLPVNYRRLNLESEEELAVYEEAVKKFKFDIREEEMAGPPPKKIKRDAPPPRSQPHTQPEVEMTANCLQTLKDLYLMIFYSCFLLLLFISNKFKSKYFFLSLHITSFDAPLLLSSNNLL